MPSKLEAVYWKNNAWAKTNRERVLKDLSVVYPYSKRYKRIAAELKKWEVTAGLWEGRAKVLQQEDEDND